MKLKADAKIAVYVQIQDSNLIFQAIDICDSLLDIMVDSWTLLRLHGSSTSLVHILVATVHADSKGCMVHIPRFYVLHNGGQRVCVNHV